MLCVGRLFDFHVLDMIELGILSFVSSREFKIDGSVLGSKPCMLFSGDLFQTDFNYTRLKNLFIGELINYRHHVQSVPAHDDWRVWGQDYKVGLWTRFGGSGNKIKSRLALASSVGPQSSQNLEQEFNME